MRRTSWKYTADVFLNILILLSTGWAVLMYFIGEPDILGSHDVACFKYFTTDSNILAAIGSLVWLICRMSGRPSPRWVTVFKFVGTVAASVTLLTVVFFLAPMAAIRGKGLATAALFFTGNVFVLHFSTPVLAIISTLLLERDEQITRTQSMLGVLPTLVYGVVYLIMVVTNVWNDWYGFTFGGRYGLIPLVFGVMLAFCLGLSLIERRIKCSC